jgi:6-phosphogluconolactonase
MAAITVVDVARLAETAAERLTARIEATLRERDTAWVSLTGGTTPRATYEALADPDRPWRHRIDWSHLHLFWGDERYVPPDHPDSNFGMASHALVQHVPIPAAHVHRIRAELADPQQAAAAYARELPDTFDVMLLGLGSDCHIASIFPGHARDDAAQSVAVTIAPDGQKRITLTPAVILKSRSIVVLAAGANKAAAVAAAVDGPLDVVRFPGQLLREAGKRVEWILDADAARALG